MKKQQLILVGISLAVCFALFFFGKTIAPADANGSAKMSAQEAAPATITTQDIITTAKKTLSPEQVTSVTQLENTVVRGDVKNQQIAINGQLAKYWGDSLNRPDIAAYYLGEEAKLENSEKKLNFAARLLISQMYAESDPAKQNWLATNVKALFEQSLQINPVNDSARIGIGACYIFGNISASPMEGILAVKAVADRDPGNLYAQMVLGKGDLKSNQLDKAIERFQFVVSKDPLNLEAIFNLAESYDRKGEKTNAINWYKKAQDMIGLTEAKKEIQDRIDALSKTDL